MITPNLEYFISYAQNYKSILNGPQYAVEAIIAIYERAILYGDDHLYTDPYLLVQLASGAQGACFLHLEDWNTNDLEMIAGQPVLDVISNYPRHIQVALLDALYYHINLMENIVPTGELQFEGTGSEKSLQRAKKLIELISIQNGSKVAIVGLIVDILRMALDKNAKVRVADLAESGKTICGIDIEYDAVPLLDWADTVIMTGNTLKTNTSEQLFKLAAKNSINVLVYSMTGHNIAPRYLGCGANVVTCETFPYYWYANTPSKMQIYKKQQ